MNAPANIRKIELRNAQSESAREILRREWLVTNGMGGYASGTISGMVSRRYHGVLIAALPAPFGRVVMLNHLAESVRLPNGSLRLVGGEEPSREDRQDSPPHFVSEFRLEHGLPVWTFEMEGIVMEKRLFLLHGQNTVHIVYRLLSAQETAWLLLKPSLRFRAHEHDVGENGQESYRLNVEERRFEITSPGFPHALRLHVADDHSSFTYEGGRVRELNYATEADRGYPAQGRLWSPGTFAVRLHKNHPVTFTASTEDWARILAIDPQAGLDGEISRRERLIAAAIPEVQGYPASDLVLAADQFIISPAGRVEDSARAQAAGDEVRTVIAGYHWFTDWGRDTMISLEGLTLTTGRHHEAGWILRTFAQHVRDGLIPNLFPEGENKGLYHTADASLWFFHAVDRYLAVTGDTSLRSQLLPKLVEIGEAHLRGTHFGIGVDTADGLLRQGAEGYQLTWMDAKVDGWVVTPRRGKAVEINALWYNALRLLEEWSNAEGDAQAAAQWAGHAKRAYESFNQRFWSDGLGHLYDIVDGEHGDDTACRPNQVFAIALKHPILEEARWSAVLDKVRSELLTPVGLRTLSRAHPDYKARYFGDLRARDAAYHQGTVWAWLIGPFIDAWLKVHPEDRKGARSWLNGVVGHLDHACVGSISEIFDAEDPFTPRGCIAQAWSVAEALRCWAKTGDEPVKVV